jgi:flagellar basal body-associated protein FliL
MEEAQKKRKVKPLFIVAGVTGLTVIVGLTAVIMVLLLKKEPVPTVQQGNARGTVVTEENAEDMREQISQPVEDGSYRTRMNVEWNFGKSTEPSSNAYVENAETNRRTVYFDLTLEETGELLYSSPFIPVGEKLEKFPLDVELPVGEHKGIVKYHLVDDEGAEITTVSVKVTLNVKA